MVWCLKQKRGIRIVQPNENLAKAYLKKAISALNTMNAAVEIRETDWITTTAYYARYFALYALLMKMGIKSEIHDCSIAIAKLLTEKGILGKGLASDISNSKQARIDIQYYVERELDQAFVRRDVENARYFVLELEKVIENITTDRIEEVRVHVRALKFLTTDIDLPSLSALLSTTCKCSTLLSKNSTIASGYTEKSGIARYVAT